MKLVWKFLVVFAVLTFSACDKIKSVVDENQLPDNILNDVILSIKAECEESKITCKNFTVKCSENSGATPAEMENHIKSIYKVTVSYITCDSSKCENRWDDREKNISLTVLADNYAFQKSQKNYDFNDVYSDSNKCVVKDKQ